MAKRKKNKSQRERVSFAFSSFSLLASGFIRQKNVQHCTFFTCFKGQFGSASSGINRKQIRKRAQGTKMAFGRPVTVDPLKWVQLPPFRYDARGLGAMQSKDGTNNLLLICYTYNKHHRWSLNIKDSCSAQLSSFYKNPLLLSLVYKLISLQKCFYTLLDTSRTIALNSRRTLRPSSHPFRPLLVLPSASWLVFNWRTAAFISLLVACSA